MKEEFVSYEIAKRLKELGFDWACKDCYVISKAFNTPHLQNYASDQDWNTSKIGGSKYEYIHISAPRLDQAQKWLREVKGIHVEVTFRGDTDYEVYGLVNHRNFPKHVFDLWDYDKGIVFHSYESALSAGIDAALNLLTEKK